MKDVAVIARKWNSRASGASSDYKDGVSTTTKDWSANAAAAEDAFKQGVTEAAGRGAFGKGVRAAGTQKWRDKASTIGASRYSQGVGAGEAAYATGFGPYAQVLSSLPLNPRQSKGNPANVERVRQVAAALHAKKISG